MADATPPAPPANFGRLYWADDFLRRVGAPVTPENEVAVVAWEYAEGGHFLNDAKYNPLNTTLTVPGSKSINSVGVKSYPDYETGMAATVRTLAGQGNGYEGILAALRNGNSAVAVGTAVAQSKWGTGGGVLTAIPTARKGLAAGKEGKAPVGVEGAANPEFVPGVPDAGNPIADIGNSIGAIVTTLAKASAWIADRHNWLRIVEVLIGGAALFAALSMLTRDLWEPAAQTAALAAA